MFFFLQRSQLRFHKGNCSILQNLINNEILKSVKCLSAGNLFTTAYDFLLNSIHARIYKDTTFFEGHLKPNRILLLNTCTMFAALFLLWGKLSIKKYIV